MSFLFTDNKGYSIGMSEYPMPFCKWQQFLPYESQYATVTHNIGTQLHYGCIRAIDIFSAGMTGTLTEDYSIGSRDESIFVEHQNHENIYLVIYHKDTGVFETGIKKQNGKIVTYEIKESEGILYFLAVIAAAKGEEEFSKNLEQYVAFKDGVIPEEEGKRVIAVLISNLKYRIENYDALKDGIGIKITSVKKIKATLLLRNNYQPSKQIFGCLKVFRSKRTQDITKLQQTYSIGREYSKEEKMLIPKMEEYIISPTDLEEQIKLIHHLQNSSLPHNIFLFGEPGSGKTTLAQLYAHILQMPYLFFSCNPDTETVDLESTIIPNTSQTKPFCLPTYEDLMYDPVTAVSKITGKYESVTSRQAWNIILAELQKRTSDFVSVPSTIITAVKKGWVVEIQEPLTIERPSVLAGINSLLDDTGAIRLMTGELIQRHPQSLIIFTSNVESAGCVEVNNSVLSRCSIKMYVTKPTMEEMVQRAESITGCTEHNKIIEMCKTIDEINERLRQECITDGCIGMRELIAWVFCYQVLEDVLIAAEYSIITSSSLHAGNHSVVRQILKLHFGD